ncbi:hypothetical protein BH11PSE5_BH11PSE5_24770 [soil metagenome]|nr:hypothetical protein Sbs19_00640 [Sphingobium sp. BS19]
MNLRFIDWIWHIRGSMPLVPEQSSEEAFDRLDPLFRQRGTSHERTYDTLTFRKKAQAPQDKMSIFDDGVLRIEKGEGGSVLRYNLTSRALLLCFLAPLLFLGFAQLTIVMGNQKSSTEASDKAKKEEKKEPELKLNPIDKFLGAPEPEKPKKDDKKKGKDKDKDKDDEKDDKPSPTPAYVFAAIFATLYIVGRILEDWLIKRLFRRKLAGS